MCKSCVLARAIAPYNTSCGTGEAFADLIWVHFPWLLQLWVSREFSLKSCQFVECWQLQDYFRLYDLFSGDYTHFSGPDPLARNSNCHSCIFGMNAYSEALCALFSVVVGGLLWPAEDVSFQVPGHFTVVPLPSVAFFSGLRSKEQRVRTFIK